MLFFFCYDILNIGLTIDFAQTAGDAFSSAQFSHFTDWVVGVEGGGGEGHSAEILFQSFLQEALVSGSGMGRNVHSLM